MQVSTFELVVFTIGLIITLIGAFWALLSMLFKQSQSQIAEKFKGLEQSTSQKFTTLEKSTADKFSALEADVKEWARLEREFLIFQRDLPLNYVRREDYVRNQSVIESKLDSLALKIENWQLREANHNAN